jgi:hypothetical protein
MIARVFGHDLLDRFVEIGFLHVTFPLAPSALLSGAPFDTL